MVGDLLAKLTKEKNKSKKKIHSANFFLLHVLD